MSLSHFNTSQIKQICSFAWEISVWYVWWARKSGIMGSNALFLICPGLSPQPSQSWAFYADGNFEQLDHDRAKWTTCEFMTVTPVRSFGNKISYRVFSTLKQGFWFNNFWYLKDWWWFPDVRKLDRAEVPLWIIAFIFWTKPQESSLPSLSLQGVKLCYTLI